jgi:hypothetical protein
MNIVVRYHGMLRTRMGLKEKTYALQPGMMLQDFIDWATEGRLDLWTNQEPAQAPVQKSVHQSGAKQPVLIAVDGRLVKDNVVLPGPRHEIDILIPNIGG